MKKIVLDMDGVLADFFKEENYMERFENEKGFFKRLVPIKNNYKYVQRFIDIGLDIYILSSSPNDKADQDKKAWLNKYIPNLTNDKIIFCRNGQDKADFMQDITNAILIDDHTPNLIKWKVKGGQAIKYINDINDKKGVHKCFNIKELRDFKDLKGVIWPMKQFHRQKRKQLNKKTIEQTTFILLTKYNWLYNYPPPTKKEIKNFLKFLQIEKLYNLYAYKIYNITKTINRHFKDFQEITECFR